MMERLLVESAVRAMLIAAGTALVLVITRIRTPVVLHRIWTSVLIAMLVLPLWTAWGPRATFPVPAPSPSPFEIVAPAPAALAPASASRRAEVVAPATGVTSVPAPVRRWADLLILAYGVIALALFIRLAAGTIGTLLLLRRAVLIDGRLTSAVCPSPVTVGWLRPVVLLPAAWREWSPSKLSAVLAHEGEHVRRRDPLVQWLALLNRALFWFSPVSWWLERRLAALAEQACDDAVLARGHDPRDYSEYLIDSARAVAGGVRMNLAGVFMAGTSLPQRIRRILDDTPTERVSRVRLLCTLAACALVASLFAVATPVRAALQRSTIASRMVARPLQPRWIPPESTAPQPVSLEWMDGDEWSFQVQSIITGEELVEYSELRTLPQRAAFIDRFWVRRDPSPGTTDNEFRDEFTRRVRYAIEHFAESDRGFGFDSDRGRVYLMFGTPDAVETQSASDVYEWWRYGSVPEMGTDFRIRFSRSRGLYCGYRIASPTPQTTIEGVHTSVQLYPLGVTTITIPFDPTTVAGAGYELSNRIGVQVDKGEIGFLEEGTAAAPLATHLPPGWMETGLGCTHALPPDTYQLTNTIRLTTGRVFSETTTFDVR
jgi:GWxTD domain-containing protein